MFDEVDCVRWAPLTNRDCNFEDGGQSPPYKMIETPERAAAIELFEVNKTYEGGKVALANANLSIRRGELFALVGPNGAGKSTVLKVIAGLLRPQSGTVIIEGYDRF